MTELSTIVGIGVFLLAAWLLFKIVKGVAQAMATAVAFVVIIVAALFAVTLIDADNSFISEDTPIIGPAIKATSAVVESPITGAIVALFTDAEEPHAP